MRVVFLSADASPATNGGLEASFQRSPRMPMLAERKTQAPDVSALMDSEMYRQLIGHVGRGAAHVVVSVMPARVEDAADACFVDRASHATACALHSGAEVVIVRRQAVQANSVVELSRAIVRLGGFTATLASVGADGLSHVHVTATGAMTTLRTLHGRYLPRDPGYAPVAVTAGA